MNATIETVEIGDVFSLPDQPGGGWEVTESLNVDLFRVRAGNEARIVRGRWLRDPAQWTRARAL